MKVCNRYSHISSSPKRYTAYEVGCPICNVPGFLNQPSYATQTTHKEANSTLNCCANDCRSAYPACKSFVFHPVYTACYFLDDVVQNTQLLEDNTSLFEHYDLECFF